MGLDTKLPTRRCLPKAGDYQTDVNGKLEVKMPKFSQDYFWNKGTTMKAEMAATRNGFGDALAESGDDPRIVASAPIFPNPLPSPVLKVHPERLNRWLSFGIAEQSATTAAAALAKEGKLPVFGTYGVFASGRNLDQLRTTVCYGNFNVLIAGAHGGVSVGPDGATHQALEELFPDFRLPNMVVEVPCDIMRRNGRPNSPVSTQGP